VQHVNYIYTDIVRVTVLNQMSSKLTLFFFEFTNMVQYTQLVTLHSCHFEDDLACKWLVHTDEIQTRKTKQKTTIKTTVYKNYVVVVKLPSSLSMRVISGSILSVFIAHLKVWKLLWSAWAATCYFGH